MDPHQVDAGNSDGDSGEGVHSPIQLDAVGLLLCDIAAGFLDRYRSSDPNPGQLVVPCFRKSS